ncbi:MAG TPA: hypothetical protein VGQ68_07140 [Gaiellaceae bacterium]|jgi:hypothetical protein|nr:hypothetical protein [Gaiellaceae bacterium]
MHTESSSLDFLRELMACQGVEPSGEDLRAVLAFLEAVLPDLERLEALLPPETAL